MHSFGAVFTASKGDVTVGINQVGRALFGRPVLSLPERIELPGKAGPISITHTAQGIPIVTASSALDVICGQGFLAGLHRPFQIEMNRRTAAARLSEILGMATLDIDRWICRLGIPEAVEASYREVAADALLMEILQRYSDGVNLAWERFACASFEFTLLHIRPESWTPRDCLGIAELMSWSLAGNWEEQLARVQIAGALGVEQAALLEAQPWEILPGKIAPDTEAVLAQLRSASASFLQQYQEIRSSAHLLPRRSGSNAFAVSGAYTDSGKVIFAADPHLSLGLPGWFYQCILHCAAPASNLSAPLHAAGAAIAGIPGIISGRNREYAWSVTLVGAMTASLYLERPDVPTRAVTHTIAVKNKPSVEETVQWTERGPLLALPGALAGQRLSLRWVGYNGDLGGSVRALWQLLHAASVEDIRAAICSWSAPAVNFCWAEVEKQNGAYGWRIAGRVPLRHSPTGGLFPDPGWIEEYQWKGFIPPEELPEEINPPRGYFVSANQRHAPENYPYPLSHEYIAPYRARRLEQLIEETLTQRKFSQADAQRIQTDQTSLAALELQRLILRYVSLPQTDIEQTALSLLRRWDGKLAAASPAAAILKVTEAHLIVGVARELFSDSPDLSDFWLGRGQTPLLPATLSHWRVHEVLTGLIRSQKAYAKPGAERWPVLFQQAFSNAVRELKRLQGPHPEYWSWGKLHQLEISHPLVQQPAYQKLPPFLKLLKRAFRLARGPFPLGGDEHTPWQSSYFPAPFALQEHPRRFWPNAYQPAVRIVAVSGQKLYTCLPGGTSGQTTHPWADNQLGAYLNGQLYELSLE